MFHPVLIHNNRPGRDAQLLKHFDEPSWNNPVVRYIDGNERDLIERKDGVWSTAETVQRMVAALRAADRTVPRYLESLNTLPSKRFQAATFAMHCYWEGEAKLGSIAGVDSTHSGWIDSLEVVTLTYDPQRVEYSTLLAKAKSFECSSKIFAHTPEQLALAREKFGALAVPLDDVQSIRDAKASDQKYYLLQTPLRILPLSQRQATKLNSALGLQQAYDKWLSPRQRKLYQRIEAVTRRDPKALHSFRFPAKDADLARYAARLNERLNELDPESAAN